MIRMKDFRDDNLWSLFEASASGDLPAVKRPVEARPELVQAQYNFTPAIHFAHRYGWAMEPAAPLRTGTLTNTYRTVPKVCRA
jgi:hypothetical protein